MTRVNNIIKTKPKEAHNMNEEINEAMNKVLKTIELWQENKDRETALQLELLLSILKLLVGINNFDELPAFARYLKEAREWLLADDKARTDIDKLKADIDKNINDMIAATNKAADNMASTLDGMKADIMKMEEVVA